MWKKINPEINTEEDVQVVWDEETSEFYLVCRLEKEQVSNMNFFASYALDKQEKGVD